MSLFNTLIGGSKRQPAPARPTTTTAKADISPIHGQLSNPSADAPLAPATHSNRRRPSRAQTDLSSYADPQNTSSPSSSIHKKQSTTTRWRTGVFSSSSLRSSPSASVTSLVEPQDDVPSSSSSVAKPKTRSPSRGSNLVRKGSTSEHEWMEVGDGDSSDDDFGNARASSPSPKEAPEEGNLKPSGSSSNKTLAESVILVEDEQKKAQLVAEELATTKQKLAEMTNQRDTLQQRVQAVEKESKERAAHLKFVKETADAESLRITRAHATEMEAKHREVEKIRESWVALQHHMEGRAKVIGELEREREVLHNEIGSLRKRHRKEEEELKMMRNEVDAANTALRTFRERSRASLEAEGKEKAKLKDQVDELWRQLGELQLQSKERDEQIQQLRGSEQSTNDAFHKVQKMVDEKDRILDDLQRRNSALEKQKEQVQERVVELETEGIETKNSAQRLLAKAKEDYKHEIALAHNRIHDLEGQVSSHSAGDRQLRSSVQTARTDAQNAIKLAEERAIEVEQLHQQLAFLENALHVKDKELTDSAASRASNAHLDDTIRALREDKDKMKADHALQIYKAKSDAAAATKDGKQQISILEKELSSLRDKLRTLRERYEVSEQSRRMLKDQLTRHEEENKKSRRDSGSSIGGSTIFNLSSSIIRDPASPTTDQVFKLLQTLNYEIFQSAALLADSLCTVERPSSEGVNTNDLIDDETTSLLGPHLLSLVRSQSTASLDSYDPYPLQTAIQATLVCCATRVMTAWYPGHWDHSDFLMVTYTRIREAEGVSASDTWKAMTRARLRPTTSTVARIVDFLEDCLNTIFRFAGWPATSPSSPGAPPVAGAGAIESLLREHREKLSALARHSLRLNVILDNVSPQLEPALVEPGSDFDHHVMETDDGNSGNRRRDDDDEVVSTAEIGLRKVADDVITPRGSTSSRGRMILKPKVVLKSSFDA